MSNSKKESAKALSDYCIINPSGAALSSMERATMQGGVELDKALQWISKQVEKLDYRGKFKELDLNQVKQAVKFYSRRSWQLDARSFFQPPPMPELLLQVPMHGFPDGEVLDLQFPSNFKAHRKDLRQKFAEHSANQTVHARWWKHHQAPAATLICIHGWNMGDPRLSALAFLPGFFYAQGLDVVLFELPYHGRRAVSKEIFFPNPDSYLTNEGMAQAIWDLRSLRLVLQGFGRKKIGVMGMSLGGYSSLLWSCLDPLQFCIPIVSLVSMADLAWEVLSREDNFPHLTAQGLNQELLQRLYALHSPLNYQPLLKPKQIFIVAGLGDQIVPTRHSHSLWEQWGRPEIHWLPGGHKAQFEGNKVFHEIERFLKGII